MKRTTAKTTNTSSSSCSDHKTSSACLDRVTTKARKSGAVRKALIRYHEAVIDYVVGELLPYLRLYVLMKYPESADDFEEGRDITDILEWEDYDDICSIDVMGFMERTERWSVLCSNAQFQVITLIMYYVELVRKVNGKLLAVNLDRTILRYGCKCGCDREVSVKVDEFEEMLSG